jgi:D-3-phosphoglycerate dehydrogenase / 2-oxoglutarate reductase
MLLNKKRILITEKKDFSEKAIKTLKTEFLVHTKELKYDELCKIIHQYDGVIVRLGIKLDKNLLMKAKSLSFIATPTTGLNHIDLNFSKKNKIRIISLKNEKRFLKTITPTAELTFGLMINLMRNIIPCQRKVKKNIWNRNLFIGEELKNKRLGVIGLGRLGGQVAKTGCIFGMEIGYFDPYKKNKKYLKFNSLKSILKWADIITIHVHLNKQTENMINQNFFKNCNKGLYLINTSRGEIINESYLLEALKKNKIKGAALDVLSGELNPKSIKNNKLINYCKNHDNLIITPHIGGATKESMRKTEEFIANKIISEIGGIL